MQTRFIPGIYNWCDRWCERCAKTERCLVFASARHYDALAKSCDSRDPFDEAGAPAPEAEAFMYEEMSGPGVAAFERDERRLARDAGEDPLSPLVLSVSRALQCWSAGAPPAMADALLIEARAFVDHWKCMLAPKISRALHGYYRARAMGDVHPRSDELDDANGTAKMVLLGLEVLVPAVETLAMAAPRDRNLRLALVNLPVIRALLAERFPAARQFVRPGWDEGQVL